MPMVKRVILRSARSARAVDPGHSTLDEGGVRRGAPLEVPLNRARHLPLQLQGARERARLTGLPQQQ